MASSGGVLGIVGLGGGRLQQSWLLTEDACVAPMGSFPDCVLWDVNRYCKKKKKRRQRELCNVSDWQLVGQDAAQVCGCQARHVHQALTLGQLWVWAGGRGAPVVILSQRPC